jgi:hypothetical protein
MSAVNDYLFAGRAKAAKFPKTGSVVSGTIVGEPRLEQQTEYKTGRPLTWRNGEPKWQLVAEIQVDQPPEGFNDDGLRSLYLKGQLRDAVAKAVRKAAATELQVGGHLTVEYVADGEPADEGLNAPKLFRAEYRPPSTGKATPEESAIGVGEFVKPESELNK